MSSASKARVRSDVYYADTKGLMLAPSGDYAIERSDSGVKFSKGGAGGFTLSIDAVYQHVFEGRIVFTDGRLLPKGER
ncbi:MAG: hypothetical protein AB7P23_07175 [Amphiplicatus sp.]